ncbi:PREDICTED: uncharacterized protein LOC105522453 [Colobus angolensis palliatus]|uniref:uncharacterized protein LOC105522453 n=1 Tax=Colobus angolensis palliatus TaxID=336983 RepID=UPI0005F50D6A|nr:PREDICTED: uncharacterized protein LOC105522453 [Colobus angolensis palliatus]
MALLKAMLHIRCKHVPCALSPSLMPRRPGWCLYEGPHRRPGSPREQTGVLRLQADSEAGQWALQVTWLGLAGVLSLAPAFTQPPQLPHRGVETWVTTGLGASVFCSTGRRRCGQMRLLPLEVWHKGPTLRPPTLAPFYFGVQGQGGQLGRVGSVPAQHSATSLVGCITLRKRVPRGCSGVVLSKGGQGQWESAGTLNTRVGALLGGGGTCSGECGVLHKPRGTSWPPGRRWTPSQRPWLKVASRGHGLPGYTGPSAGCFVLIGVCVNLCPASQLTRKHGSCLSLFSCIWKAVSSRASARLRCPEAAAAGSALSP